MIDPINVFKSNEGPAAIVEFCVQTLIIFKFSFIQKQSNLELTFTITSLISTQKNQ